MAGTVVTVDGRLPVYDNGGGTAYAHPTNTQWIAIYEKAAAQYLGQIDQMLNDGRAVTTGTRKDSGFLWWSGDGEYIDDGKLVSGHEYSVESVDMNAHPPTITLLNPWGTGSMNDHGQSIGKVTLTEDEWHKYFREIGVTQVRP